MNNKNKPLVRIDTILNSIANYGSSKGIGSQTIGQYVMNEIVHLRNFQCEELTTCSNDDFWMVAERHLHLI